MPRRCTVCDSPKRAEIDKALVNRASSFRELARRHRLHKNAIANHYDEHLPASLVSARDEAQESRVTDLMEELERCFHHMRLLREACDRWLKDPNDPSRYDLGPRSENVSVVYSERTADGRTVRRKALLSTLLARVRKHAPEIEIITLKHPAPSELLIKTAARYEGHLELLARLLGKIKEPAHINVFVTSEWQQVQATILRVLAPHPSIRLKVAEALGQLSNASSN